jgi:predicted phage terminase large subunit-like protein
MTPNTMEQPDLLSRLQLHRGRQAAEGSLLEFTKQSWKLIEPGPLNINWHVECICEHLEAVAHRQCLRLLINVPPRHMKSLGANVFFPAWVWARYPGNDADGALRAIHDEHWSGPGVRFLHITYRQDLTTRDSTKCRRLIESEWYQENWGHRFALLPDQNQKTRFENDKGGYRFSGTMTSVTGWGGNIIVYDDPHDVLEVESSVQRQEVIRFWSEQLTNRLDPDGPGAFIIVMQRTHARDLSGYIIANEFDADVADVTEWAPTAWRHICLPARFEKKHPHPLRTDLICKRTLKVWSDPRQEGEALWPGLFSIEELDRREKPMSPYAIAGQMQQRPVARSGGVFKREWFGDGQFVDATDIPDTTKWVRHWDLAATEDARADYTCGVKLGRVPDGRFVVGDVIRVQKEGHEVRALILNTAAKDGRQCMISLPKDPGQAGKVQARDFVNSLAGYDVKADAESGSKVVRAEPVAAQAAQGNLVLKRATWNDGFLDELCMFPAAPHDDQVDALSGAFARFVITVGEHSSGWVDGLH